MKYNKNKFHNKHQEVIDSVSIKYDSLNPISKKLIADFYAALQGMLSPYGDSATFLEIGCGPGESTKRILRMIKSEHLEASEFEQEIVDALNYFDFPIPIKQESVYELKRKENEFDCVLLLEVLEHLDDFEKALQEIFRVSRDQVVISVPNEPLWCFLNILRGKYWNKLGNTPGHINHWNVHKFIELISKYGDVVEVKKPLPWIIVKARKRH